MKPHNDESKKSPARDQAAKPSRFQIVKLEERIAPSCRFNPNAGKPYSYYGHRYKVGKYVGNC